MKRIIIILTIAACLMSCTEKQIPTPGTYEYLVAEMCGDYVLTGIHWSGSPIDLDGDGTGYNDRVATQYGPISFEHLPDDYTFLKSISEIMITDFESGELTVRIRCSLTDPKQEVKTDYIHYYYKRI